MALLVLKQVRKVYAHDNHEVTALVGLDLTIAQGAFVVVMGPSGSGKSTLMHLLGCLDQPTAGHYWLQAQCVSQLSKNQLAKIRNRSIGFVFQQFCLLQKTSALDNVCLPLLYAGVNKQERQERAHLALKQVGLANRSGHMPNQLSGGQQQRVALARAIVHRPMLLLADEPTGNLDSRTSLEIMTLLQAIHQTGVTLIMVTHEPAIAAFAERVLWMKDGALLEDVPGQRLQAAAALQQVAIDVLPTSLPR